jgi:hypothetical protein
MRNLKLLAIAASLVAFACPVFADSGVRHVPCGYQQVTVTTLQSLTIPAACNSAPVLAVITAEVQAVRYRDDGVAPTASVGMPLAVGTPIEYQGTISALQFIAQTSGGIVNILFYK